MSGFLEKTKEALGMGHSSSSSHSTSSSSSMGSGSASSMRTSPADVSYNAEGGMLNQSGSGFGASAANMGAPGSTVDPTMGTSTTTTRTTGTYSGLPSSLSSSSTSTYGTTGGHHHHHHSSSTMSSGSLSSGSYGSSSSLSSSAYGTGYGASGSADNAMTRSEEQLLVGKERVEVGQAALRKTITSEHVETAIPLIREKVVLEREPITEANRGAAYSGPDLKEAEYVVKTAEERPVVQKEVVAKERVHLGKVAEVASQQVGGDIRKEHIEFVPGGAPVATTGVHSSSSGLASSSTSATTTDSSLYNKDRVGRTSAEQARKEANY